MRPPSTVFIAASTAATPGPLGSKLSFAYITADPSNPTTVYGSYGGDVYKSVDQGATWSILHSFGSPVAIGGGAVITGWIGVDPKNSSVIYVSLQQGHRRVPD